MPGKGAYFFLFRHRGSAFHPGNDHALGHIRQRILQVQRRGRTAKGADARTGIIGDSKLIQPVHLLPDRSIQGRIPGMQADRHPALFFSLLHLNKYFFQSHYRTVINPASFFCQLQKFWIYQRSGVDHLICFL